MKKSLWHARLLERARGNCVAPPGLASFLERSPSAEALGYARTPPGAGFLEIPVGSSRYYPVVSKTSLDCQIGDQRYLSQAGEGVLSAKHCFHVAASQRAEISLPIGMTAVN